MANKIEYSRLVFKRSGQTGVVPTEPTGTTIDNTWLDTDILIGEGFINTEDDKMWFRTNNGIVEISMSGVSSDNYYTEQAYLSGNTLVFDRNDTLDAYSVNLSSLTGLTGSGDFLPLSGGSLTGAVDGTSLELSGALSANTVFVSTIGMSDSLYNLGVSSTGQIVRGSSGLSGNYLPTSGGTLTGSVSGTSMQLSGNFSADTVSIFNVATGTSIYNLGINSAGRIIVGTNAGDYLPISGGTVTGNTIVKEFSATSVTLLNSGATARDYYDYSSNHIATGVTNSSIIGGSGNTISSGLRNVIIGGVNITASSGDTAYFSKLNATTILSGGTDLYDIFSTSSGGTGGSSACDFSFAISDETTQIAAGVNKLTFYAPYAMTITDVYASLSLSGNGTSEYNIKNNGTTILSTVITIDANEFHSNDATTPPVITGATVSQFDRLTVDIDSVDGSGQAGAKIYIVGTRL